MSSKHTLTLPDGTVVHGEPPGREPIWERVRLTTGLSGNALLLVVAELRRNYTDQELRHLPPGER